MTGTTTGIFRRRPSRGATDGKKEACKTYIEQTKLLVTLASAFLVAPAGLVAFFSEKSGYSIGCGGLALLLVAEIAFVASVVAGYVVLGSVTGSQAADEFDVYRPATMKSSLWQLGLYLGGLIFFVLLTITIFHAASNSHPAAPTSPPPKPAPLNSPTAAPTKSEAVLTYYPFWFDLASGSSPNFTGGTRLDAYQLRELKLILHALIACVGDHENENVELGVRGFADTNMFPNDLGPRNILVANARASNLREAIVTLLPSQTGHSKLVVDPVEQNQSQPEMERVKGYFQTAPLSATGATRDQGRLNRRAEIIVKSSGVCRLVPPN